MGGVVGSHYNTYCFFWSFEIFRMLEWEVRYNCLLLGRKVSESESRQNRDL